MQETPLDATAIEKYPFLKKPPAKKTAPHYENFVTPARFQSHLTSDPLAGPNWDGKFASIDVDYVADDGKALTAAINGDVVVVKKIKDVLNAFQEADDKAKAAIEEEWAKVKP